MEIFISILLDNGVSSITINKIDYLIEKEDFDGEE